MKQLIVNPYKEAVWENQYLANFHTHCNQWSVGHSVFNPDEAIDLYYDAGYKILALTEHLTFVWPWTNYDRDPDALGMVAIKGAELFSHLHHTLCLFESITKTTDNDVSNIHESYDEMMGMGASGILAHPRYPTYPAAYSLDWYIKTYLRYPFMFGMEVFNPKYGQAEEWWDEVLSVLMPFRPVWGTADHDMHSLTEFDKNCNIVFAKDLTLESVREAMESGNMVFCTGEPPRTLLLNEIVVDEANGEIFVDVTNATKVEWITNGGVTIATGNTFVYKDNEHLGNYIRAKITGTNNNMYTQPFGFYDYSNPEKKEVILHIEKTGSIRPVVR